ncbi:MAG: hypothetical protein KC621_12420 [Myxococcales bacterium]|nr:hypothetical protein [Myxococcales bacterium]
MFTFVLVSMAAAAEPDVGALLCAGRTPCRVVRTLPAGKGPEGEELRVVELVLEDVADEDIEGSRYPEIGGHCTPFELHAVVLAGDRVVHHRLLVANCNDGYGASTAGEDRIEVGENQATWSRYGGSAWRWSEGETARLWPPARIGTSKGTFYFDLLDVEETVDWTVPERRVRASLQQCLPGSRENDPIDTTALELPKVAASPDWPKQGLGCAARVDSADASGLVMWGGPGDAGDASLAAMVTTEGELRVEVTDDHLVPKAKKWLNADHLEIWAAADGSWFEPECLPPLPARQWAVMLDGTVIPAEGDPPASDLSASVVMDGGTARFTIRFRELPTRLSVVWSDSDDGKRQERLIGTSAVEHGVGWTLSSVWDPRGSPDLPGAGYEPPCGGPVVPVLSVAASVAHAVPVVAVPEAEVTAAVARCGTGFQPVAGQSFRLDEPGKPWDQHAIVPSADTRELCLVHLVPGKEPVVWKQEVVTCMNCTVDEIAAVGFNDINGDGVPDVSVAASGVVGWDPQSEERFVGGWIFAVLTGSADWSSLTDVPEVRDLQVKSLKELWAAMKAKGIPAAPAPANPEH